MPSKPPATLHLRIARGASPARELQVIQREPHGTLTLRLVSGVAVEVEIPAETLARWVVRQIREGAFA